ncbi:MAG: hypothetical protein IJC66_00330 [Kiritimatiellae bacterium]|nr:hypothetical protein [Kiritimatiellia bacterium]
MKSQRIIAVLFTICALCGIMPAWADISDADLASINRRMKSRNGFSESALLMKSATAKAAKTPDSFRQYLAGIGNGIKEALEYRDIAFSDVLGIVKISNHLDGWARAIPGGIPHYTRFVESVAEASKAARPASIGGKLGCQMQLVLFALAIENKDIAKAEAARQAALSLSRYEGDEGFVKFCVPILDVAFTLISKDSAAALSLYEEQHKKLTDMGLADMEEVLWPTLVVLHENGTNFGKLETAKMKLDAKFNKGVKIRKVYPDTAAARAGWRNGDRIVEVAGKTILYNSDDGGRGHLEAVLAWRRTTPNRKPTIFKLKRGETFLTSEIAENSLGIEF